MENETLDEHGSTAPQFWDNCYLNNDTGWDMHRVSPPLKGYIDSLGNKEIKVLIPGCGNAYEAQYLLEKGFKNVTVVDISKVLTSRLEEKFEGKPLTIINQNFFDLNGRFDLILEQTFFCALDPSLRKKYVQKCYNLLNDNGKIAGVLFNKKFSTSEPPYVATDEEYQQLFTPLFTFIRFEACNNSIAPRMGNELFFEFQKKP